MKKLKIDSVCEGSIAWEMELKPGDHILTINNQEVGHILDYQWLASDGDIIVEVEKADGEIWELDIEKEGPEGLGIGFTQLDLRCANACIFCFVDQQPPGLRDTLYIKDDDYLQSFEVGNYITLTNLDDEEINRIIKHRLYEINISVHTTNPALREKMMGNSKAGELMPILKRFNDAGINMNFQIVLVKGINDARELDDSIAALHDIGIYANSLAIVPVGLTAHRTGLYPLEPFSQQDAANVIAQVEGWQWRISRPFVYLADEWYVLAGQEIPDYEAYGDFPQLSNGVGMMALFEEEFIQELDAAQAKQPCNSHDPCNLHEPCNLHVVGAGSSRPSSPKNSTVGHSCQLSTTDISSGREDPAPTKSTPHISKQGQNTNKPKCDPVGADLVSARARENTTHITIATGQAAAPFMTRLTTYFTKHFPTTTITIHPIINNFYGHNITVSGLLTGRDIITQLTPHAHKIDILFIPENAFRENTNDMLDGTTLQEISAALGTQAIKGSQNGSDFCKQLIQIANI